MKNEYMYTIRMHLGRGKHCGWWQVREYISNSKQGKIVEYIDPSKFTIILRTCYLYNRVVQAEKILNGAHKEPCAWICVGSYVKEDIELFSIVDENPYLLEYNPRKNKHWMVYGDFGPPDAIDKEEIQFIYTKKTKLYI